MSEPTTRAGQVHVHRSHKIGRAAAAADVIAIEQEARANADPELRQLREVVKAADWDYEPEPWKDMARKALAERKS